jgi:hypothetical protein
MFPSQRTPRNKSDTIKSEKSGVGSYPDVPVCGLCNGDCLAAEISVLCSPRSVTILRDVPARIECERASAHDRGEQHDPNTAPDVPDWIHSPRRTGNEQKEPGADKRRPGS